MNKKPKNAPPSNDRSFFFDCPGFAISPRTRLNSVGETNQKIQNLRSKRRLSKDDETFLLTSCFESLGWDQNCWQTQISLNGTFLTPIDSWKSVCQDVRSSSVYLEYSLSLTNSFRLERRLFLHSAQKFVFVADALISSCDFDSTSLLATDRDSVPVRSTNSAKVVSDVSEVVSDPKNSGDRIQYKTSIPLATGIRLVSGANDREYYFRANPLNISVSDRPFLRFLSLEATRRGGRTARTASKSPLFDWKTERQGRNLFVPFFFDLKNERFEKSCFGQKLTVGENLEQVSDDVAVGYRIQRGDDQYLVYASLANPASRSVLGRHLNADFFVARFVSDDVAVLLQVDRCET